MMHVGRDCLFFAGSYIRSRFFCMIFTWNWEDMSLFECKRSDSVLINQPTRECISIICNIGKLNDLCIINFTCYNLYGNIMRGKYYISITLHLPYFH